MLQYAVFNPRRRSLLRGNLLVTVALACAVPLSDFPNSRATLLLIIPTILSIIGTLDTARCMQKRWNFYHAGVVFCVYMDLMAMSMIAFMLLYPYFARLSQSR